MIIVAGGPVRDRAWMLPLHIKAVRANKPNLLYYLEGDSIDGTKLVLSSMQVNYEQYDLGLAGGRGSDGYKELWKVRNRWAERALELWPNLTHLWVVDSDVIPGPFVLKKLLAVDKDVVGAHVPIMNGFTPIHMDHYVIDDPGGFRGFRLGSEYQSNTPHKCYLVGGCYLIKKEALEKGLRWGPHPQGEDGYIANQCRELGLDMWVDPTAKCLHIMNQE